MTDSEASDTGTTQAGFCPECETGPQVGVPTRDGTAFKCPGCENVWEEVQC